MCTAMLGCQSLVTFSVIVQLRSVTQYINCREKRSPEEEDWEEMDCCFLWQHFQFPFSWPHFFSCLSLRGNSRKTAGPHVATRLREQQCSSQHWQHTEHTLLQQQRHLTRGHTEEQHRAVWGHPTAAFNVKKNGLVASEKNEEGFFYTKEKKKRLIIFWGSHCVCECVREHTMHEWTQPVGSR